MLSLAQRKLAAQTPLLSPSTSKFTQSIDVAIPGNHTNLLYNRLSKPQASILVQLRTGSLDYNKGY